MLNLYRNIKRYRLDLGMSQEELAQKTGYKSRTSIAKIEKGLVDLPQSKIALFAKALNVDTEVLMGKSADYEFKDTSGNAHTSFDSIEDFKRAYVKIKQRIYAVCGHFCCTTVVLQNNQKYRPIFVYSSYRFYTTVVV